MYISILSTDLQFRVNSCMARPKKDEIERLRLDRKITKLDLSGQTEKKTKMITSGTKK